MPSAPAAPRNTVAILSAAVLLAALLGCSATSHPASHPNAPAPSDLPTVRRRGATYTVPDPLPAGRPGALVAASDGGPDRALGGGRRWTVLYHSTGTVSGDEAVSGVVVIPPGHAPAGGWPVVSWAHGTTGIADRCAPSEAPDLAYPEYAQEVATLVRHGYAVAATDYPAMGTPGINPYLVGVDEANSVVDIVTAAHQIDGSLSPVWFASGHSQGGQAALFTAAARASQRAGQWRLQGVVAIAPASGLDLILAAVTSGNDQSDLAYAVYALIGLSTVEPSVGLDHVLGPAAAARLRTMEEGECLEQTDAALTSKPVDQVLRIPPAELSTLSAALAHHGNPDGLTLSVPALVVQGADDQDVPAGITHRLVGHLQARGAVVDEHVFPGLGHDAVIGPSICDRLQWMASHGGPPAGPCAPYPSAP